MIIKLQNKGVNKKLPFRPELSQLVNLLPVAAKFVGAAPETIQLSFVDTEGESMLVADDLDLEYFYEQLKLNKNIGLEVSVAAPQKPAAPATPAEPVATVEAAKPVETAKPAEEPKPEEKVSLGATLNSLKGSLELLKESFEKAKETQAVEKQSESFKEDTSEPALPEIKPEFVESKVEIVETKPATVEVTVSIVEPPKPVAEEPKVVIEEKKGNNDYKPQLSNKPSEPVKPEQPKDSVPHTAKRCTPPPARPARHGGVRCDGCGNHPIIGIRYKCLVCENFDLCEKCEDGVGHDHPMIRLPRTEEGHLYENIRQTFLERTAFYKAPQSPPRGPFRRPQNTQRVPPPNPIDLFIRSFLGK